MHKSSGSLELSHPMTDERSDHYPQFPASFSSEEGKYESDGERKVRE